MKNPSIDLSCILKAEGDLIKYNETSVNFNDLFNMSVVNILNERADNYLFDSPLVNEIYRDSFIPLLSIEEYLKDKNVSFIATKNASRNLKAVLLDYADIHGISSDSKTHNITSELSYGLFVAISFFYLGFINFTVRKKNAIDSKCDTISICRTPAAFKKIIKVLDANVLYESSPGKGTVYEQLSFTKRIRCLFRTLSQQFKVKKDLKCWLINKGYKNIYDAALYHYRKRIIHTLFYENIVDEILDGYKFTRFVTGNNLDRFAMFEEMIAKRYGLKLVCIPHGIEYGYRFPKCFIGDLFYTTSQYAETWLNNLYGVNKFKYDSSLMDKVFSVKKDVNSECRIVFFSEPRESEVSVQIIREMCEELKSTGIKLYLKLHPKDNYDDYKMTIEKYEIGVISDLNEAITGNYCIARKSTTLVEALHNDSKAYAIIVNDKDKSIFNTFPSLQDPSISYFEDVHIMMTDILKDFSL